MTLEELTKTHRATRHPLTLTTDDLMGDVETLGSSEATLNCRFVPSDRADRERYGVVDETELYRVIFSADPGLDNSHALVWNSKVWRVREVIDSGGIGRVWRAVVQHCSQIELSAS